MNNEIRIVNGLVFDPTNKVEGKVCDICIKDGKIVEEGSATEIFNRPKKAATKAFLTRALK